MREENEGRELMNKHEWLAEQFEAKRTHLQAVAYRMLGSLSEADDAVQESWLRLSRSDTSGIENLGGWLTTVVARICLDMLRSRNSRREESLEAAVSESIESREEGIDPEQEVLLADSVGLALLVVLETLAPAERLAFVLHDLFGVPFDEIAPIVGRSPTAARQLASRARRRVQGAAADPGLDRARDPQAADLDRTRQREIVDAFLAASRGGDFEGLLALLDPDVVFRADAVAVKAGMARRAGAPAISAESRGATAVAGFFSRAGNTAQLALINGAPGSVWAPGGRPRAAFAFTVAHGKVVAIEMVVDPERLRQLDLTIL